MKSFSTILAFILLAALAACGQSKDALFEQGQKQFDEGNYNGAIVHFKNVLEKDPNAVQARLKLGAAYLETGKFEQAEKELQKVYLQNPYDPEVSLFLGKLYNFQRKPDQAMEALNRFLKDHPKSAAALEQLGYSFTLKGDNKAAREQFQKAVDLEPDRVTAKLGVVETYMNEGDKTGAKKYLEGVLTSHPKNRSGLHMMAILEEDDSEASLGVYRRIASLYPNDVFARYKEARILLNKDGSEAGDAAARKLIQEFPDRAEGHKMQGLLHYRDKNYGEAVNSFQRALKLHPDLETYYFLGLSYYGKGDLETAITQMQTVVDYSPSFVKARQIITQIFMQQGRLDEAIAQTRKILEIVPNDSETLTLLGDAQQAKGDPEGALESYGKALEATPNLPLVRIKRGALLFAKGQDEEAEKEMSLAVASAPNATPPRLILSAYYLRANQPEKAYAVLEKGLTGAAQDSVLYNAMSKVRFLQGKTDEVFLLLNKAKEVAPDNRRTYHNLAIYHILKSEPEKAIQEYVGAIEKNPADLQALFSAAVILDLQGRQEEALKYLMQAKATGNPEAYIVLSRFYFKNNNSDASLAVLDELLKAHPDNIPAWQMKAGVLLARKEVDKALDAYNQEERLNPRQGLIDKVNTFTLLGQFDKARESAEKLILMNPRSAMFYIPLAWTYEAQKDLAGAITALERGLAQDRDNAQVMVLMGQLHGKKGDIDKAMTWFDKALAVNAQFAPAFAARGTVMQMRGDMVQAVKNYSMALDYDERNGVALNNLAMIYADQEGRQAEALKLAMTAYEAISSDPSVIDTLGYALLKNGRNKEALQVLQKADGLRPKNPVINYHMAMALKQLGQKNEALTRIQVALSDKELAENQSCKALLRDINGM